MNATTISMPTPNWSARAYAARPPVVALCRPDAKALLTGKVAKRHIDWPTPLAHPDYQECDCRHWDMDGYAQQPDADYTEPSVSDTEWCALLPLFQPHGEAYYMAWGADDAPRFCDRPAPVSTPKPAIDTTPLVMAAARKEPPVYLKNVQETTGVIAGDVHMPLAYVKDAADHDRVMAAYQARVRGEPGAQDTWNALSAGACRGLTVDESLRRFGRPVVLA